MDVAAYLERIGYSGPATPNAEALRDIHRAHLFAVPFENLDIGWKREIRIDQQAFLRKIIEDRRGGFCYELNGAFAALLRGARVQGDIALRSSTAQRRKQRAGVRPLHIAWHNKCLGVPFALLLKSLHELHSRPY